MSKEINENKKFARRKFKMGSFQTIIMIIVLVVVVLVNIVIARMNWSKDMNSDYLYTLSSDTVNYLKTLKDDVTIYYLVEDGHEAQTSTYTKTINIENIINLYDGLGTVKVEKKNPVLYPDFAKKYTSESIMDNDMIVVNNRTQKSEYLSFQGDMIEMTYDTSSGSMEQIPQTLKLESSVTSAIQKVSLENTKKVYVGQGHSMQTLNEDFTDLLSKNGMEKEEFDLTKNTKVPDDCSLLILHSPAADITDNEYTYISKYLKEGGKALFLLNYTAETPNYDKLLKDYGINVQAGYVLDPENYFASYGSGAYMLLTPEVSQDSELTSGLNGKDVLCWYSKGMTSDKNVRSTLTVESVLSTSEKSYSKKISKDDDGTDLEKKEGDQTGPFSVAMTALDKHAENTKGEGHATKIFAIGSVAFMDVPTSYGSTTSIIGTQMAEQYNNRTILVNSLKWLVGDSGDEIRVLNIPDRSLLEETVQLQSGDITFWTTALVVVLPLAMLLCGFLIWNRRRKK
ncbi:MAG: GldG family protein [Eubacterium sp.]|nr:GldG family protein [Eubacterium sp.]